MISKRFEVATVLLLLAPFSAGIGTFLLFQAGVLGSPVANTPLAVTEATLGAILFALAFPLFFPSLGVFGSRNNSEAARWIRWLGWLRPKFTDIEPSFDAGRYRNYTTILLLLIFIQAILLIPGIGEDRYFPLNQFYGLFSSLWYFYVLSIGVTGFLLIRLRRPGGYLLALILCLLGIGTGIPDVLGLLPPSAPTPRTTALELTGLPIEVLLIYFSSKALRQTG